MGHSQRETYSLDKSDRDEKQSQHGQFLHSVPTFLFHTTYGAPPADAWT